MRRRRFFSLLAGITVAPAAAAATYERHEREQEAIRDVARQVSEAMERAFARGYIGQTQYIMTYVPFVYVPRKDVIIVDLSKEQRT